MHSNKELNGFWLGPPNKNSFDFKMNYNKGSIRFWHGPPAASHIYIDIFNICIPTCISERNPYISEGAVKLVLAV